MANRLRLAAVIPAAGLSSRMGAFKPLLPYGARTVIESSVENALAAANTAVITLGKRGDELRELLTARFGNRIVCVENPDYAFTDMLCSVRIALRELGACDAFFITPADMPMIGASVYHTLAGAFELDDEILIPVAGGKRGHPPLIGACLIPDILAYDGEGGLRGFFREHKVREIAVEDAGVLKDLDTPGDYASMISDQTV